MKALLAALALAVSFGAQAQATEVANPDPVVEKRLKGLAEELRCLVCQNQTIADSNAPLALDLRNQIRGQIAEGRSDAQIRDYMVERYGDFVLYRPPFNAATALLWLGPALLILGGGLAFYLIVRRRRDESAAPARAPEPASNVPRRAEIEALLSGEGPPGPGMEKGDRKGRP